MDDDFKRSDFYDAKNLGPTHLINITINATTGGGDQLTQRDRQGIPMAITPNGVSVEGTPWSQPKMEELTIGQWIGISGAAFSTGIGRGTSLGKALVLALTNVRLGWWWNSGLSQNKWHKLFPLWRNQTFLLRELRASFRLRTDSRWSK